MLMAYVSGKYRDPRGPWYVVQNIRAAEAVALKLWQLGYAVICPHKNTEFLDGPLDDPCIIAGDIEMVKRSDVVVMVDNWQNSIGAKMEMIAGYDAGKPIFFAGEDDDAIESFVNGKLGLVVLDDYRLETQPLVDAARSQLKVGGHIK